MCAKTCLKSYSWSIIKVLDFINILNELRLPYTVTIVGFYFIFTAQSPLNTLKCYIAGNVFFTVRALIGYLEVTCHLTMKLFPASCFSVTVISLSLRLRLITPTSSLIILDITKTSSNNCCFLAWGFMFVLLCSFAKKKTGSVFPAFCHATFHHAFITYCNVSRAGLIAWCITIGIHLILVKAMWPRVNQCQSLFS